MKPLVLTSKACFLAVRRHKLLVTDYLARSQAEYTARQLPFDSVIVYRSGGSVSFEAVRFLMQNGVPIFHLSWDGTQVATTLPPSPISGKLRLAQYRTALDARKRGVIATTLIREKVSKSVDLLRFLARRYPVVNLERIERVSARHSLPNFEAQVAGAYWDEFAKVVQAAQPKFDLIARKQGSNNMGATDPVNSLLNYAYAVLESKARLSLQKAGLDPDIGFLHSSMSGAAPLVYDTMELFRWLIDLTVVEVIETRQVRPEDFQTSVDYKVSVKEEAAHRLVARLAQNFNRSVRIGNQNLRFDTLLDADVRRLTRFIEGDRKPLVFSCPFAADETFVESLFASRILNLSVDERKALEIPKTTYFYIRKAAMSGRPFRLYRKTRSRCVPRPLP